MASVRPGETNDIVRSCPHHRDKHTKPVWKKRHGDKNGKNIIDISMAKYRAKKASVQLAEWLHHGEKHGKNIMETSRPKYIVQKTWVLLTETLKRDDRAIIVEAHTGSNLLLLNILYTPGH
ncbi:hypothetical protein CDAR_503921 [Caerostris darwini]|uniref:Uncharacterized protein n=1 Tax=Caerostris darwini TaxID=1538125 RepID=A0AAV4PCT1_9ARAC|nr:hypothetical protein CDAR_503921 [Caerostris darwini]